MTATEARVRTDAPEAVVDEYELLACEPAAAVVAEPRRVRPARARATRARGAARRAAAAERVRAFADEPVEALVVELHDETQDAAASRESRRPADAGSVAPTVGDTIAHVVAEAAAAPVEALAVEADEPPAAPRAEAAPRAPRLRLDAGRLVAQGAARVAGARTAARGLVAALRQAPEIPGARPPAAPTVDLVPTTDAALALDPARQPIEAPDADTPGDARSPRFRGLRIVDDGPRRHRRNVRVLVGASVLAATALLFLVVGFNVKLAEYQFELDALEARRAQAERVHEDLALEVEAKRSPMRIIPAALGLGLVHATGARPLVADLGSGERQSIEREATGNGNPTP